MGVDVILDFYPYLAGSTGLDALLPPWVHEGGLEETIEQLKDPEVRGRIRREMKEPGWRGPKAMDEWGDVLLTWCKGNRSLEGKSIREISALAKKDPLDVVFDLLVDEEGSSAWYAL
ncbi:TPA: hypothetical protein EYP44_00585 [Candidatus Bathyarchaeota archaeon]|nr:hypothetical protein [Candidatus Bathyarchaeota archaeon]